MSFEREREARIFNKGYFESTSRSTTLWPATNFKGGRGRATARISSKAAVHKGVESKRKRDKVLCCGRWPSLNSWLKRGFPYTFMLSALYFWVTSQ